MFATNRREITAPLLVVGIAALVGLIYSDSFASMAAVWSGSGYGHGIVVFPISAYLLWRLRGPLAGVELRPWAWGMATLVGLVLTWLVARSVGVQAAEHLAIVLLIPAAVATCLGTALTRRALFPLLFLAAAVPIGDALSPYLMRVTADVSATLLRGVGVPVFREGQFITLPGGEFEVADVCSGLRYLVAGTMIALLFAYLTYRSNRRRALFVVVTATSLVVVNGVRAFVVMWVASATEMRVLGGEDHIYFGWLLFAVTIGALFWLGVRYSDEVPLETTGPATARGARALPVVLVFGLLMLALTAMPLVQRADNAWWLLLPVGALLLWAISRVLIPYVAVKMHTPLAAANEYRRARGAAVICLTVAVLAAGPVLLNRLATAGAAAGGVVQLPVTAACLAPSAWAGSWRPELRSPDFDVSASYRCPEQPVNVFVAGYLDNVQGKELVSEENRVIPDAWRRFVTAGTNRFDTVDGRSVEVNEVRVEGGGLNSLVWYWYLVGERTTTTPVAVKINQAIEFIRGGRSDGTLYWLETPLTATLPAAAERLASVARELEAARTRSSTQKGDGT
jgi:exosortase A